VGAGELVVFNVLTTKREGTDARVTRDYRHRRRRRHRDGRDESRVAPPSRAVGARGAGISGESYPQQAYAPPADDKDRQIAQLKELAELKAQVILTEEEFAAQKAQVLGG
jgi:hypothetical protein